MEKEELEHLRGSEGKLASPLLWFLHALKFPPTDPLTLQLLALVDGLESIPGPKTVGPENYARISAAFFERGWPGFEDTFDAVVPRSRQDYADVKRDLLRESIFSPKVHSRMARLLLGKATVEEMMEEIERDKTPI